MQLSLKARFLITLAGSAASWSMVGTAAATPTFTAPDLPAGSHYRILFGTSDTIDGTSGDIATYNSFVSSAAALNPDLPTTTWSAIVSTSTIGAIANIACSPSCDDLPIYAVDGTLVATSLADLFDGSVTANVLTESGVSFSYFTFFWTGTNDDGTASSGHELGQSVPTVGWSVDSSNFFAYSNSTNSDPLSVYAISGDISTSVPEPATASLLLVAAAGLAGARRRRRMGDAR